MALLDEKFSARPKINRLPSHSDSSQAAVNVGRFPKWLHRKLPRGKILQQTNEILKTHGLNTVCEEAKCPNRLECYSKKTATFLALGKECTRACGFCDIDFSKSPAGPDPDEPIRIATSAKELGLKHVVLTMVARDDLPDGGADHIAAIMKAIRKLSPATTIEVLTSDFSGNPLSLDRVLEEKPEIFNHNIETVRSLTSRVRHKATYDRTLSVLEHVNLKKNSFFLKSGIMVGLGETAEEVKKTITDLHRVGCDIITIGQYLQASHNKLRVKDFISPDTFKEYEEFGYSIGIKHMYCGPFVRSSYNADLLKNLAFQNNGKKDG